MSLSKTSCRNPSSYTVVRKHVALQYNKYKILISKVDSLSKYIHVPIPKHPVTNPSSYTVVRKHVALQYNKYKILISKVDSLSKYIHVPIPKHPVAIQ
ncbi:hypothetical protein CDAR_177301, partial [Caerostris darwini]